MTDLASIAVSQSESSDTVDDLSPVSDTESTDTTTNDGVVEGDVSTGGDTDANENAVEGGDQATSSETYADFEMPEGVTVDTVALDKYSPLMKEMGLTQDQAQQLVSLRAEEIQASQVGQAEAFTQLKEDWQEQSKSDSEIGGDKFEQSVSDAREALGKFGTPELSKLLNDFGVGNHPEMIRFMSKVGNLTKEDVPGNPGSPTNPGKNRIDILYPSDP